MSERNPVTSDDLRTAAKFVVGAVRKLDPELFGKRAYGLEWTRSETITHIAAGFFSLLKHSRQKESRGAQYERA